MLKTQKKIRTFVLLGFMLFSFVATAVVFVRPAFAQSSAASQDLVTCSGYACKWCDVFGLLQRVFNTAEAIVFPLVVIYIIYGAVLYIISSTSGSEEGLEKARATVTDAIIGLVLILLTFVIVNATIIGITGSKLENFIKIDCSVIDTGLENSTIIPPRSSSSGGTAPSKRSEGTIREQDARNLFLGQDPSIRVNKDECAPGQIEGCTNVAGMQDDTIQGILDANQACAANRGHSCNLMITGGTETDHHNEGEGGHLDGGKVDFSHNSDIDNYVRGCAGAGKSACYAGTRTPPPRGDGAPLYKLPVGCTANCAIWADEPGKQPHWDVTF